MRAFIFDTETTGLVKHPSAKDHVQPKVIEFGANIIDLDKTGKPVVCSIYSLINPKEKISEKIKKITGIAQEWLDESPTFEDFCKNPLGTSDDSKFASWPQELVDSFSERSAPVYLPNGCCGNDAPFLLASLNSCDIVVAHNLPFDYDMLELEFKRLGLSVEWPRIKLCTVQEHFELYGKFPKLPELYEAYTEQPLAQTHRALDDVDALTEVVRQSFEDKNYRKSLKKLLR